MPRSSGETRNADTPESNSDAVYAAAQREWAENDRELRRLADRQATLERILAELRRYAAAEAPGQPQPRASDPAQNGGPPLDADAAMRHLTIAYKLSPRLVDALRSVLIIELEHNKVGASAKDVATTSGVDDRSGTASTHTYLERLRKLGVVERLAGKPARFQLTDRAREVARQAT